MSVRAATFQFSQPPSPLLLTIDGAPTPKRNSPHASPASYICRGPFVAAESAFVRLCGQLQTANVGYSKARWHSSTLPHSRKNGNIA